MENFSPPFIFSIQQYTSVKAMTPPYFGSTVPNTSPISRASSRWYTVAEEAVSRVMGLAIPRLRDSCWNSSVDDVLVDDDVVRSSVLSFAVMDSASVTWSL